MEAWPPPSPAIPDSSRPTLEEVKLAVYLLHRFPTGLSNRQSAGEAFALRLVLGRAALNPPVCQQKEGPKAMGHRMDTLGVWGFLDNFVEVRFSYNKIHFLNLFFFLFLGLHLQHMEAPRLGFESELQLPVSQPE